MGVVVADPNASIATIDDPDEETLADDLSDEIAADFAAENEPTMIRPTPLPEDLTSWTDTRPDEQPQSRGRIGKYQVFTRLASGTFGTVYTAYDPSLDRSVALKVLRPNHRANQDVVQRFLQEARATARVVHPGIVTIHDCGTVETRRGQAAFIAMELLSGESLSRRLERAGRLAPSVACEVARQVASALEAAHCVDVLHRDLKPDNIFLVPDPAMPSGERVKIIDFGLAKLGATGHTQLETVFGTPRYMSPEQTRSATQIDHRSDIYALGCVLFELVTGRPVFDGDICQLVERHQSVPPPSAAALAPEVPRRLDQLIREMLAKDPMDRPQTMGAVQRSLRAAVVDATDDVPTLPPTLRPTARSPEAGRGSQPISVSGTTSSHRRLARASSAPPVLGSPPNGFRALASVEVSPELLAPPRERTTSGEIVVPAVLGTLEPLPPADWSAARDRRRRALIYLCVALVAALTGIVAASV
jgi:serine/threonine protein kinase